MSVSTRRSATVPFVAAGYLQVRRRAEGGGQGSVRVGRLVLQKVIQGEPHDLGQLQPTTRRQLVDATPLVGCEVDLRASCRHTADYTACTLVAYRPRTWSSTNESSKREWSRGCDPHYSLLRPLRDRVGASGSPPATSSFLARRS